MQRKNFWMQRKKRRLEKTHMQNQWSKNKILETSWKKHRNQNVRVKIGRVLFFKKEYRDTTILEKTCWKKHKFKGCRKRKQKDTILDQFWKKHRGKKSKIKTCRKIEKFSSWKKSRNTTILEKTSWKHTDQRVQEKKLEKITFATNSGKTCFGKNIQFKGCRKGNWKNTILDHVWKKPFGKHFEIKGRRKRNWKKHILKNRNTGKHQLWKKHLEKTWWLEKHMKNKNIEKHPLGK